LQNIKKKSVIVASADVHRPAAIDQLETLAKQIGVKVFRDKTRSKTSENC